MATKDEHVLQCTRKCVCKKEAAINYCQECQNYLCITCTETHQKFRGTSKHKLHSVENIQSMTQEEFNNLRPTLCPLHNEPLGFFCEVCNSCICTQCWNKGHTKLTGKHKVIQISEAYRNIEKTAEELEKTAQRCRDKLDNELKKVIQNREKLEESRKQSLKEIDNHEKEMMTKIKDSTNRLNNEVERKYKNKKKIADDQIGELTTTMADVKSKVDSLNQLLKSDEATAVKLSDMAIAALKDRIEKLPKTEPDDNGKICYKQATLQIHDIGEITEMRAADYLTLQGGEPVTQGQNIVVQIIKSGKIESNELKATWTYKPNGKTFNAKIDENSNGDYTVTTKCTSAEEIRLDVSVDDKPIKNSPMIIKVEKEGLVKTIEIYEHIRDVVKCEEDYLLFSSRTNKICKYKQSGEYICDIILPYSVQVYRMYMMKNGNLVFSDRGNKCIKVCNMNMEIIKSIGKKKLKDPSGVHVDEASNVVYVTDWNLDAVFTFDINTGEMKREIGSPGKLHGEISSPSDVHITKQGNIHVLESQNFFIFGNGRLQSFNKEGRFIEVLVKAGNDDGYLSNPRGVAVDDDDNIIITSKHKVQLFSSDGKFIKRIDKEEDVIYYPWGLAIISSHPRRIAVANRNGRNVKIFNY